LFSGGLLNRTGKVVRKQTLAAMALQSRIRQRNIKARLQQARNNLSLFNENADEKDEPE
jgi:hypothetical protein